MKHLKKFEKYTGEYKFYWIVPFDDRLTESIIEIVRDLDSGYYGNRALYRDKNGETQLILDLIKEWTTGKNLMCGILTYNAATGDWDISRYNEKEIKDCDFKNYIFKGLVNIDESELEIYKETEKYNL